MSNLSTYTGGLTVSAQMKAILAQPGYIKSDEPAGGQRLRELYRAETANMDPFKFSAFGFSVFTGSFGAVKDAVESGKAPPLAGTETPYKTGYASFAILGAQRVQEGPPGAMRWRETLEYLFAKGMPPDVEDIVGNTALHHATTAPTEKEDMVRCLLENGADVNHRNRYGEVCIMGTMMLNLVPTIDILMEYGADLDIPDADDWTPRKHFLSCGPQVTAAVTKWIRKREGTGDAPREEKRCDGCGLVTDSLKNCAKCKVARYCSVECQRGQWPTHKKTCQSFSSSNTVTLKPYYQSFSKTFSTAEIRRGASGYGIQPDAWSEKKTRGAHVPKKVDWQAKTLVIKVQVPYTGDPSIRSQWDLLVYTKTRDFTCSIRRADAPGEYDRISEVVYTKGVGGAKAYFSAELESKDRLVVKVSEVLAEQPW